MEEIKSMMEVLVALSALTFGVVFAIVVILFTFAPTLWTLREEQKSREDNKDDLRY